MSLKKIVALAVLTGALVSCNSSALPGEDPNAEASPIQYHTVGIIADNDDWAGSAEARRALADGRLTESEYDTVLGISDAEKEAKYRVSKEAAIAKWSKQS